MPVSIKERITTDLRAAKVQNQQQTDRTRTTAKMVISEEVPKMGKRVEGISHSQQMAIAKMQAERLKAKLLAFQLQLQQVL
jgi:hypothetical protein